MFDKRSIGHSFGKAADHYDAHAELQREVRAHLAALAKPCLKAGSFVFDAGCGTGALFDEKKLGWRLMGADLAYGMCERAAQRGMITINGDAQALPLADKVFDGVFSSLMLQWMNRPEAALGEMARVLRTGGYAAIATFAEGTLSELSESFRAVDSAPHVSRFLTPETLISHAHDAGFELVAAQQVRAVEYYPDAVALMRRLQDIGATNHHAHRKKGLMTSRQFARLERAYQAFAGERGLPASWQVLYLLLKKE